MLYIVLFLHQTTTIIPILDYEDSCISYYSYIKPQLQLSTYIYPQVVYRTIPTSNHNTQPMAQVLRAVVYRTIPTSNHNQMMLILFTEKLYIVLFLHQTTTPPSLASGSFGCISYYSYIKPQPFFAMARTEYRCISYYSYIKPQLRDNEKGNRESCISYYSYIKPQLSSQRLRCRPRCISYYSYIKPQQVRISHISQIGCISYYSYIKPQPFPQWFVGTKVVYRTIPTSNHNIIINVLF